MKTCTRCESHGPFYSDRSKPDGLSTRCKACVSTSQKTAHEADPEKKRARDRSYQKSHTAQIVARQKLWVDSNREHVRTYGRARYAAHPEKQAAATRAWRALNPEKVRTYSREAAREGRRERPEEYKLRAQLWERANPEKRAVLNARSRVGRLEAMNRVENTLTAEEWVRVLEYFGKACAYCLTTDKPLTVDHIIPISRGGSNTADNVVPACKPCNSKKGHRPLFMMVGA